MNNQDSIGFIELLPKILHDLQSTTETDDKLSGLLITEAISPPTTEHVSAHLGQSSQLNLSQFNTLKFEQQVDIAIIVVQDSVGMMSDQSPLMRALQRCRDVFARHTLLLIPNDAHRAAIKQQLIGIGFQRLSNTVTTIEDIQYQLWQFNLFDYKYLPDWLNSKFWANPENWDKYRW